MMMNTNTPGAFALRDVSVRAHGGIFTFGAFQSVRVLPTA